MKYYYQILPEEGSDRWYWRIYTLNSSKRHGEGHSFSSKQEAYENMVMWCDNHGVVDYEEL